MARKVLDIKYERVIKTENDRLELYHRKGDEYVASRIIIF